MYPFMPRDLGLVLFWYLGKVYPVNKQRLKLFHLRSLILSYTSMLLLLVSTQAVRELRPTYRQRLKTIPSTVSQPFIKDRFLPLVSTQAVGPPLSGSVQKVGKDTVQGERIPP